MTEPRPDCLGKRQHELNTRVNDAFTKKIDFNSVKDELENTTLDKFFKIDLAAKCRNIDYIIDILKAGETLYAHRALKKCQWLYDDEYCHIVNPEYLHDHIFPVTSMRVKRLILKTVVMRVRRADRAATFYHYCMKIKMTDVAFNCLLFTSEEFKLDLMQNHNKPPFNLILYKKHSYIQFILGRSVKLFEAYIKMFSKNHNSVLRKFRYFYSINKIKYLELFEQYANIDTYYCLCHSNLDEKLCEDIMKKHKDRVLAKPIFYSNVIHRDIFFRNITTDDAKIFIVALLPSTADEFWNNSFVKVEQAKFFNLIPRQEMYEFTKKIFNDKYPGEEFEMSLPFYEREFYELMTIQEREEWAFNHIRSDKQILGVGNDYKWYKFVNFKVAFEEIKNFVLVTKDADKRSDMLKILVQSPRNSNELKTLFDYYNKRHMNEVRPLKENFMTDVISHQNVFEFDDACWSTFYTLLLSMELYNKLDFVRDSYIIQCLETYKTVTLIYHILHQKDIAGLLMDFLLENFMEVIPHIRFEELIEKLNDNERLYLYEYLYTFYTDRINEYKNNPYNYEGQSKVSRYFRVNLKLMYVFNVYSNLDVTQSCEPPMKPQKKTVKMNILDRKLLRKLKKEKNLVVEALPQLKIDLSNMKPLQISNFLRKIKIYFPNDVGESFRAMYEEIIYEECEPDEEIDMAVVDSCVYAIFELGNENVKINFMNKYAPENAVINYTEFDTQKYRIQKSICRYASKSLPPVPLTNILAYMKGDYVRYCLHIFSIYVAALPLTKCISFVETLSNVPVSIQKHALRMAFQCLDANCLINMSKRVWDKTKNVSLRSVIYSCLYNRIVDRDEKELREILNLFTLNLREDDEDFIFSIILKKNLPADFLGEYKKTTWKMISEFKDKEPNIERKTKVISGIRSHLHIMDKELVKDVVDNHINRMFIENNIELNYSEEDIAPLFVEMWLLAAEYIFANSIDSGEWKYIELAQSVVKKCLEKWNEKFSERYLYQRCCWDFIVALNNMSNLYYTHAEGLVPIYEAILDVLQGALPLQEIYIQTWEMKLAIANRQAIKMNRKNFEKDDRVGVVRNCAEDFGIGIGKVISEFVDKNMYFKTFSDKIKNMILKSVDDLLNVMMAPTGEIHGKYFNDAIESVALGLVSIEISETYLIAIQLLPEEKSYKKQFLIDIIQKFLHPEVQYAIQEKLQNCVEEPPKRKRLANVRRRRGRASRGRRR